MLWHEALQVAPRSLEVRPVAVQTTLNGEHDVPVVSLIKDNAAHLLRLVPQLVVVARVIMLELQLKLEAVESEVLQALKQEEGRRIGVVLQGHVILVKEKPNLKIAKIWRKRSVRLAQ